MVEQIIRPTGLVDPEVDVRPVRGQVDDLLAEIRVRETRSERVLVTTLTKRMSEDLTDYLQQAGVRVRYLHSDIDAIERMEILRGLRLGDFDVLVGINLLREGLDLPEVSLVAILDADQEGFLRSGPLAGADHRPRGAAHQRPRDAVRRSDHRVDAARAGGNGSAPGHPAGLQPGARHHAALDRQVAWRRCGSRPTWPTRAPSGQTPRQRRRSVSTCAIRPSARRPSPSLERQMREAAANLEFELAAMLRDQLNELKAAGAPDVRRAPARAPPPGVIRPLDPGGARGRGRGTRPSAPSW